MNKIQGLTVKLDELEKESRMTFAARAEAINKRREEFYNYFIEFARKLIRYGNPVSIKISIIDGAASQETFILTLTPYEEPDKLLTGVWEKDETEKTKVISSFNPNMSSALTQTKSEFIIYCPEYVFVQVYSKKDEIYELFETAAAEGITKHIQFNEKLIKLTKQITS